MRYLISYDIDSSSSDNNSVADYIKATYKNNNLHLGNSFWIIRTGSTSEYVINELKKIAIFNNIYVLNVDANGLAGNAESNENGLTAQLRAFRQ